MSQADKNPNYPNVIMGAMVVMSQWTQIRREVLVCVNILLPIQLYGS